MNEFYLTKKNNFQNKFTLYLNYFKVISLIRLLHNKLILLYRLVSWVYIMENVYKQWKFRENLMLCNNSKNYLFYTYNTLN